MDVLVACETSGAVRNAFRDRGHDAWSCDLLPSDDLSDYHIQGDALEVIPSRAWDLMIAHPPCTYLCNSGVGWLRKEAGRPTKMRHASKFFYALWNASIPRVVCENPIPHRYGRLPRYTQIIQPYQFGHPERKATCLWVRGVEPLQGTKDVKREMEKLPKHLSQRLHYASPSPDRWKIRSKTYTGIAQAMATQWG